MSLLNAIDRSQFLHQLMQGAFFCTLCTACSTEESGPFPIAPNAGLTGNTTTQNGPIDFRIDLASDHYKKLSTEGAFMGVGDVLIAHLKGGSFIALSKYCTHAGFDVQYDSKDNLIFCPSHGSKFGLDGVVQVGPAVSPLKMYQTVWKQPVLWVKE
jgi:cytochrome b6-f complex iron-sulfur subunit